MIVAKRILFTEVMLDLFSDGYQVCYDILERQNYSLINHLGRLIEDLQPTSMRSKDAVSPADASKIYEAFTILKRVTEDSHKKQ